MVWSKNWWFDLDIEDSIGSLRVWFIDRLIDRKIGCLTEGRLFDWKIDVQEKVEGFDREIGCLTWRSMVWWADEVFYRQICCLMDRLFGCSIIWIDRLALNRVMARFCNHVVNVTMFTITRNLRQLKSPPPMKRVNWSRKSKAWRAASAVPILEKTRNSKVSYSF